MVTHAPVSPPPLEIPSAPHVVLPRGACDSHCHIYGPFSRYPLSNDRRFTPSKAPETALRRLHARLGIDRAVIVQSVGHGDDHQPMLDALAIGDRRYRGVALIRAETRDAEIAAFATAGVCGARFSLMPQSVGRPPAALVQQTVARVRPHGWHIAIDVSGDQIVEEETFMRDLGGPVVIDHMARPDLAAGLESPAVLALLRLLDSGRVWVKLSGADRISRAGAPYADVVPIAARLAAHAPERVLWGTDWPHVNLDGPMPDDGVLTDLIAAIAPSEAGRQLMLVDNPVQLFGFPPASLA